MGLEAALEKSDSVITSYRNHATHVARGGTVEEVRGAGGLKGGGMEKRRQQNCM